ncbi:MAG: radical SAM protein [candidate division WOR-3 bacterium]
MGTLNLIIKNSQPIFIDWAITTKCHLNCVHCRYFRPSKDKQQKIKELSHRQAIDLAKQLNKISPQWILIEGGEPFLRADIFEIIEILKPAVNRNNIPIYIISSGMDFNQQLAEKCQQINVKLMISVDSSVPKTYEQIRQGANYQTMIKAIEIAQSYNLLDSINVTLQPLNYSTGEIDALGKFAFANNIRRINFLGFKPNRAQAKGILPTTNYNKVFDTIANISEQYQINVQVDEPFFNAWTKKMNYKIKKSPQAQGPIVAEEKLGCIFGEYLFIEPDGLLKPCSFSPLSYNEIGLTTIKSIRDKTNRKGKCGKCQYQLICGGCRVRTFMLTGDWHQSDPFCPL